ncbi:MAG: hypothetical protein WCW93_03515 [Candidatus Paceibacterota bacterium]
MDPETEKIIKEQMEKLPDEIKKIFTDPELGNKIINIGRKNGLNIEQLGIFQTETYLVMLGLVHPDEYQTELKDRLKINNEKANTITKDVNEQMLSKIFDQLKKIYEEDEDLKDENMEKTETLQNISTEDKKVSIEQQGIEKVPNTEKDKKNAQILSSAPIEVLPAKAELMTPPPILTQKLSGFVKNDVVETDHSLKNLTTASPSYPAKADPYRLSPDE